MKREREYFAFRYSTLIILIILALSSIILADEMIPRSLLFEAPDKIMPQISPSGKYLSYLAPIDQVMNIWIRTIGKNDDYPLTKNDKVSISKYFWSKNENNILYLQDNKGDNKWHLWTIDLNKKKSTDLTPFSDVSVSVVADSEERPDEILIAMNKENRLIQDLYKLNITNGSISLIQKNPGNVMSWVANKNLDVLGAISSFPNGGGVLMYRDCPECDWREILTWQPEDYLESIGLTKDGKYWLLVHNVNSDVIKFVRKNVKTLEETVLYDSRRSDVTDIYLNSETGYPIAALEFYDEARWQVLDKKFESDFKNIEKKQDTNYFFENSDSSNNNWLLYYLIQGKTMQYYVYNRKEGKSTYLFSHRPRLDKYNLPKFEPVVITMRDGLKTLSYLIKAQNNEKGKAPLIIFPASHYKNRSYMEFDMIKLWLANRGYNVLVVNYRGLYGFGKKIVEMGKREWGGKIINDIEDAVDWAVKEKIADPDNIGIFGYSMGGYVALASSIFSRVDFKVCISVSGPMDLLSFIESIPSYAVLFKQDAQIYIGDPEKDRDMLKSISPFFNISKFNTPCLISQGKKDVFVNVSESYKFAKALKARRIPVNYIEFANEGHGYPSRRANLIAFAAAAEKFLAEYLGGKLESINSKEKKVLKDAIKIY